MQICTILTQQSFIGVFTQKIWNQFIEEVSVLPCLLQQYSE
jgi:hypothetical protein